MKSNICYIYSQKCALEIADYNQFEKMKSISISPTRLSELDFKKKKKKKKKAKKKGPEKKNVKSPCYICVLLADVRSIPAFCTSESGSYPRAWHLKRCWSSDKPQDRNCATREKGWRGQGFLSPTSCSSLLLGNWMLGGAGVFWCQPFLPVAEGGAMLLSAWEGSWHNLPCLSFHAACSPGRESHVESLGMSVRQSSWATVTICS